MVNHQESGLQSKGITPQNHHCHLHPEVENGSVKSKIPLGNRYMAYMYIYIYRLHILTVCFQRSFSSMYPGCHLIMGPNMARTPFPSGPCADATGRGWPWALMVVASMTWSVLTRIRGWWWKPSMKPINWVVVSNMSHLDFWRGGFQAYL